VTAIFIASGRAGFSGEQLLRTALAQFPTAAAEIGEIRRPEQGEAARRLFLHGGFAVVDITDKPVEASAKEILEVVGR